MKKDALAKKEAAPANLAAAERTLTTSLAYLAAPFGGAMAKPEVLAEAYDRLKDVAKVVEDTLEVAKKKMRELVRNTGTLVPDTKGSYEARLGTYQYSIRPTRTGTDPKKLEALLRSKEKDPALYMDAVTSYKVSEQKLGAALAKKVLTKAELETCSYDESYALQPPKKVEE
jgi:hypothetical protein